METIGAILMFLGVIVSGIGSLWLLIVAFQESLLWGLGCLLVPFVSLIFVIMNWEEAKTPFLVGIGGGLVAILGMMIGGGGAA